MGIKGNRIGVKKDDFTYLPPHMRYAMGSPAIGVLKEEMTKEQREAEEVYTKKYGKVPVPALNYYILVRGSPERLERAYREVGVAYKEHLRRKDTDSRNEATDQIGDIREMIKKANTYARSAYATMDRRNKNG